MNAYMELVGFSTRFLTRLRTTVQLHYMYHETNGTGYSISIVDIYGTCLDSQSGHRPVVDNGRSVPHPKLAANQSDDETTSEPRHVPRSHTDLTKMSIREEGCSCGGEGKVAGNQRKVDQ